MKLIGYVAVVVPLTVKALDNGFSLPQMGYNSWYDVGMSPSETLMRATVDSMVATGLVSLGFR
jgi:hypothetical protein